MHVEESSPCGGVASGERPLLLEREKRVCTPVQARTMNESSTVLWLSRAPFPVIIKKKIRIKI